MPNPTASGKSVCARTRPASSSPRRDTSLRAPVTPVTLTQYTNPLAARQDAAMLASVLVGASNGISEIPQASHSAAKGPDSAPGKSTAIIPSTPALSHRAANAPTP